jgi:predicted MPP superfamily phosphohydrolase
MTFVLVLLALLGHGFLCAALFNRTHAVALKRRTLGAVTALGFAWALFIPAAFWLWFVWGVRSGRSHAVSSGPDTIGRVAASDRTTTSGRPFSLPLIWPARLYLGLCWLGGGVALARWVKRKAFGRRPAVFEHNRSRFLDFSRGPRRPSPDESGHHFVARLPGNQILRLELAERALRVPRLAAALDRVTIVHLSDLHFTGRIGKAYFDEVVRLSNRWEPDLVAITGDLVDRPACIDWIPDTLGNLTARYGTYFVLGNHDVRLDADRIRRSLIDCGLVDLGGRWTEIRIRGEPVVLAGNGLPWLRPAAHLDGAPPPSTQGGPLRIALAHSPDQLAWAREHHVDLLLAGHTHGGQIRVPLVGPILSATRLGAAYSAGVFHVPPTILHVARGVSAQIPLRICCPSEMARLVLRTALSSEACVG